VARKQGTLLGYTPGSHDVFHEEPDGTFTIETRQDAQAILDENKRKFNDYGDKLSVGKMNETFHQAASIPKTVMDEWIRETNGDILQDKKLFAAYLNNPDWALLKTAPIKI
jgi:hypothetical protein